MNQCWISGPLRENATVFSETALRFTVQADLMRFGEVIEMMIPCHMEMVSSELADFLVSEGEGVIVEFCGEIFKESENLVILVDPACFRIVRIPDGKDGD
ncbi:hypothetical protein G0Q06_12940 [Puniceicoccales bacterium CK1056]|uniref:Uncharacterized protein n=1 Tax=Oceanipulchritudo coccoides TaxID=2706888 RepID=A0A6B2M5G8_9BACT|nr:hypothetical protein [Oceanipulchritudo coccoides]NDV63364.1 hypothetical protein [Oceanipulchritudo coccoides]